MIYAVPVKDENTGLVACVEVESLSAEDAQVDALHQVFRAGCRKAKAYPAVERPQRQDDVQEWESMP